METQRPLSTIVFDSSADWNDLRKAILLDLAATMPAVRTRVRAGMVLTSSQYQDDVTYGPHVPGKGRRLERYTQRTRALPEIERDRHLQDMLICLPRRPAREAPLGLRIIYCEALTFTDLDAFHLDRLVELPVVARNVVAYGQVPTNDHVGFELLWRFLMPIAIVSDGVIIEHLEDAPEFSPGPKSVLLRTVEPEIGQGVFYEFDDFVYLDNSVADCEVPPAPARPAAADPRGETPVGRALGSIGFATGARISTQDDATLSAATNRSEAFYECPDVNAVEHKVKNFLLNQEHEKGRWVKFADHGYFNRGDDALVVASAISSALYGDFPIIDARPTADTALQFTVPVLLRLSPWGRRLALTTSWTYRPGRLVSADLVDQGVGPVTTGLWLGTAHADRTHREYAEPRFSPFGPSTTDWPGLANFVEDSGLDAVAAYSTTIKSAGGWLLLPHSNERSAAFAEWVRRNRGGEVYKRQRLGGRVTVFSPTTLGGLGCATGTAVALRLIQSLLGLAGIRSFVDMHYD